MKESNFGMKVHRPTFKVKKLKNHLTECRKETKILKFTKPITGGLKVKKGSHQYTN